METKEITPAGGTLTPAPASAGAADGQQNTELRRYEDCIQLIESATTPELATAALPKLRAFFQARLAKRASEAEKDTYGSVKRATESGRTFKKFAKPAPTMASTAGGGGLGLGS